MDTQTIDQAGFTSARLLFSRLHYGLDRLEYVAAHPNFEPAVEALIERPEILDQFDSAVKTDRGVQAKDYFILRGIEVPADVEIFFEHERPTSTDIPPGWCIDVCIHTATTDIVEHFDSTGWHPGPC